MHSSTLIIEDDHAYARILERIAQGEGFTALTAPTGEKGLELLREIHPALVLCDIGLPGIDGIEVVRRIKAKEPGIIVIVVTGQATVENAVEAIRAGAFDIIQKTSDVSEIRARLYRAMDAANLKRQIEYLNLRDRDFGEIIGESELMGNVKRRIGEVAVAPTSSVLVVGDTGTGKELVARAVHRLSNRRDKPLIAVNCAAVPENLMESAFLGHEKGAFSGADKTKVGLFETAHGSTLFLDEIGELDLRLQAKLLRVLEERVVTRVGGTREIKVDVRLIAATNRNLEEEVAQKRFREDLLYRIKVFDIHVPPLRERDQDVLLLARHFMLGFARQMGKQVTVLSGEAEQILLGYNFPGNVRQLRNLLEQAVILAHSDTLGPKLFVGIDANLNPPANVGQQWRENANEDAPLDERMADIERVRTALEKKEEALIAEALRQTGGNKTQAAQLLGMSRFALQRRLKSQEST
ncbi:MAG: sigma-54-dependent Fis family transcriptional regulator [Deltaproteobacteria bacterium]|nr:sigma-54-dependent Fis family transcriptional regulator [Deltaproteobacteria bacterium]